MLQGLFLTTSALLTDERRQQVLANDLAQSNTPGYRSESVVSASFGRMMRQISLTGTPIGSMSQGEGVFETVPNLAQGSVTRTGRSLDIAIEGPGFMAVRTASGTVAYTRDGALSVDASGTLVTSSGAPVLDSALQPIRPGPGAALTAGGTVVQGGKAVAKIALFDLSIGQMTAIGGARFAALTPPPADTASRIIPGALEASNVNPVDTLTAMIHVTRQFEANRTFVQQDQQTLDTFIKAAT